MLPSIASSLLFLISVVLASEAGDRHQIMMREYETLTRDLHSVLLNHSPLDDGVRKGIHDVFITSNDYLTQLQIDLTRSNVAKQKVLIAQDTVIEPLMIVDDLAQENKASVHEALIEPLETVKVKFTEYQRVLRAIALSSPELAAAEFNNYALKAEVIKLRLRALHDHLTHTRTHRTLTRMDSVGPRTGVIQSKRFSQSSLNSRLAKLEEKTRALQHTILRGACGLYTNATNNLPNSVDVFVGFLTLFNQRLQDLELHVRYQDNLTAIETAWVNASVIQQVLMAYDGVAENPLASQWEQFAKHLGSLDELVNVFQSRMTQERPQRIINLRVTVN